MSLSNEPRTILYSQPDFYTSHICIYDTGLFDFENFLCLNFNRLCESKHIETDSE